MTIEDELSQFRRQEKRIKQSARTIPVVYAVLATASLLAFSFATVRQIAANRESAAFEIQIKEVNDALRFANEKELKYEALAKREADDAHTWIEECQKTPKRTK